MANAVGTGVADDKAVYAYMPRIIRYYLNEDPILDNVPTNICREPDGLAKTLANLDKLVTKPVGEAGGYGVVIGPRSTKRELAELRAKLTTDPTNYISQPMVNLSVSPTLIGRAIEPRHVDLRPFALTGDFDLGAAGWANTCRAAARLAYRQLVARRWIEGYLGPCLVSSHVLP